jgi:virulence-associated protein VapD
MTTAKESAGRASPIRHGVPAPFKKSGVVYALTLDLDPKQVRGHSDTSGNNAYLEIRRVLEGHDFQWRQGRVYFGGTSVTAASVSLAVIDLTARLPWFAAAVRDIRMLRIEESNDLMPLIQRVAGMTGGEE